jgi:hypothetical protein
LNYSKKGLLENIKSEARGYNGAVVKERYTSEE